MVIKYLTDTEFLLQMSHDMFEGLKARKKIGVLGSLAGKLHSSCQREKTEPEQGIIMELRMFYSSLPPNPSDYIATCLNLLLWDMFQYYLFRNDNCIALTLRGRILGLLG